MSRHAARWLAAVSVGLLAATLGADAGDAQSLGEVARREAERRAQVTSGRVYTNGDLAPAESPSSAPSPAEASSTSGPAENAPAPALTEKSEQPADAAAGNTRDVGIRIEGRPKRDEQYWRTRARDIRDRLAKATAEAAAAEARLKKIEAGPQTPSATREREVAVTTLTKLRAGLKSVQDELARLEARARVDKIPPEWTQE